MAHFAQIEDNIVIQVIVIANEKLLVDGIESEQKGIEFCKSLLGKETNWIQTSYSGKFRKRFAGIGFEYSQEHDGFIPPKPVKLTEEEKITFDEKELIWVSDRKIETPIMNIKK